MERRFKFSYPPSKVDEPVLFNLIRKFDILTNIRKADVTPEGGLLILDLRGDENKIEQALAWVREQGIQVQEQP